MAEAGPTSPSRRRGATLLVVLAVFSIAVAMRTIPLYWSPLPATLDGILYAAQARDAIATGHYPLPRLRADNFGTVGLFGAAGLVLAVRPLALAQPLIAVVGAASCLAAVAIVRRFGRGLGWPARRVRAAVLVAGVALAVEGLYLRRTGVPDEEALGLLLLPLLAVGLHRTLLTSRPAWLVATGPVLVAFPLTHTFSTLLAALTITALLAAHVADGRSIRSTLLGLGVVAGFWIYFAAYYEVARRTVLVVPYVGRVLSHPGLFVAWVIVLVAGVAWVRRASARGQRAAFLLPVLFGFAVLVANVFAPVFPGTVPSPPLLAGALLLYLLPVAAAALAVPRLGRTDGSGRGIVVLSLLAAPVVGTYFSLTAALTPEFFDTVMRTQTFAHVPVFALAALAVGGLLGQSRADGWGNGGRGPVDGRGIAGRVPVGATLAVVLLLVAALTAPIAFVDLDTLEYPSTTTEEEFAGATFAATRIPGSWATDHAFAQMAGHYYRSGGGIGPVADWLAGGLEPACPVLAKAGWARWGAHLFPAAPRTIPPDRYRAWQARGHLVYATTGPDAVVVVRPRNGTAPGC